MTADNCTGSAGKKAADSSENYDPGIRVKREDPEPIRGRGFAHIDTAYSTLGIEADSEIAPGEVDIFGRGEEPIHVVFEFDQTNPDFELARGSMGFELSPVQAHRLAAYLEAWATWKQTGEWNDPEAGDV